MARRQSCLYCYRRFYNSRVNKPGDLFDRDAEWSQLSRFAAGAGSELAVVYGRRRQGKSFLLQALAEAAGGLYWEGAQQSRRQNLESFAACWGRWTGAPFAPPSDSWEQLLDAVFAGPPGLVVIDEAGYLVETAPEFPSLLQRYFGRRARGAGGIRVVLCGSVLAQMTKLMAAGAPLRGRQGLNLRIDPFDYRVAADYWGLREHPAEAFRLHALIGGTAAYKTYCGGEAPRPGRLGPWAERHLLNPASPLHHEGGLLVAEDPSLQDRSLYWGLLNAVADGHVRRSALAQAVGRPPTAIASPLATLVAGGWIEQRADPLHAKASTIVLAEPLLRTHRHVLAAAGPRLVRSRGAGLWQELQPILERLVYPAHLEMLAAEFLLRYAAEDTTGGRPNNVGPSVLRARGGVRQLDVVAVESSARGPRVCAVGEVKSGRQVVGGAELQRLDEVVAELGPRADAETRRLLFAETGFTVELQREGRRRGNVELIDLDRLYRGV